MYGERRSVYRFWCGNLRETGHSEDAGVDLRIILRLIFRKWDGKHGPDSSGSEHGEVMGTCKRANKSSDSIKMGNFLTS
jgi:hypothetical protein